MTYTPPDWHADGYRPWSPVDDAHEPEVLATSDAPGPTDEAATGEGAIAAGGSRGKPAAAIALVLALMTAGAVYVSTNVWGVGQTDGSSLQEREPLSVADRDAAAAIVLLYGDAWQQADCEKFQASTTADMRLKSDASDCDEFVVRAARQGFPRDDFAATVRSVEKVGETIIVRLDQSWSSGSLDYVTDGVYTVVQQEGTWRVDGDE